MTGQDGQAYVVAGQEIGRLEFLMEKVPLPLFPIKVPAIRFMVGEPMKVATQVLARNTGGSDGMHAVLPLISDISKAAGQA